MSIPLDSATRKKLVLVKQLYQQAVRQSSAHPTIMDRIMAVIGFDLAIETTLKAAALAIDPTSRSRNLSQDLITSCERVFQTHGLSFPSRGNMLRVRDIRNDAQHEARYPNDTEMGDCRVYARDILNHLLGQVWNESLDTISLVDLIQDASIKQFFTQAEQFMVQVDYPEAAAHAIAGMQRAIGAVRAAFVGRDPLGRRGSSQSEEQEMLNRMRFTVLYLALGIDFGDIVRLDQTVGHVVVAMDGTVRLARQAGMPPIDRTMAESAFDYCVDVVARIEQRVGDLKAPFGVTHWF